MKYSAAVLAFAGSALAAGGADAVNQVLTQIASDLQAFDASIKGFSGGSADALTSASKKIGETTTTGAGSISSGPELSVTDAVGITSNVQSLQTTLDATLSDLKGIGPALASGGHCGVILEQLSAQGKSAQALQDAITSKAPSDLKAVAAQLGGSIGASISDTNSFFAKTCAGAPSGGASSSGSSSSSSGSAPAAGAHDQAGGHGSMTGSSSSGSSGSSSSSGSSGSAGSAGSSGSSGSAPPAGAGSKTNKAAKTTTAPKPATYTGAASTLTAPLIGAIALAVFAL